MISFIENMHLFTLLEKLLDIMVKDILLFVKANF